MAESLFIHVYQMDIATLKMLYKTMENTAFLLTARATASSQEMEERIMVGGSHALG